MIKKSVGVNMVCSSIKLIISAKIRVAVLLAMVLRNGAALNSCKLTDAYLENQLHEIEIEFGNVFEEVDDEIQMAGLTNEKDLRNGIILIGNTGAGKSSLGLLLSGNSSKLQSVEISEGDFYISDNNKIGSETIVSKTLYPNLLIDSETGIIVCDSPGFLDTRTSVHELIAASSMKMALKTMKKVKIVLVVTHSSLKKGEYRADFTNLLKQTIDFVQDIEKYKNSFYLVATKAENKIFFEDEIFQLIPDETVIKEIYLFLNDTKSSLETNKYPTYVPIKTKLIKIIESLMEKTNDNFPSRINIFRKPLADGSLNEMDIIQGEKQSIREMLFKDDYFTDKSDDDFGYSISPSAKLYVNNIISFSKKYMISLVKHVSEYFLIHLKTKISDVISPNRRKEILNEFKLKIIKLEMEVVKSQTPAKLLDKIKEFSNEANAEYGCNLNFQNIYNFSKYLLYLDNFSNVSNQILDEWSEPFKSVKDFIISEMEYYNLLDEAYIILSSYKFQRNKNYYLTKINQMDLKYEDYNIINDNNFISFLNIISLGSKYNNLKPNNYTIDIMNRVFNLLIENTTNVVCRENEKTLLIEGYILKLSDINDEVFKSCDGFMNLIIFSMSILYIDVDLIQNDLKGKQIAIVAHTWRTIGTRKISVDGKSEKLSKYPKASVGKTGINGVNGGNGGIVIGIGENFENEYNFQISANGGDGQDGQEGGDGKNGENGSDGVYYNPNKSDDEMLILLAYNSFNDIKVYDGSLGRPGGDSGSGGLGGRGGVRGSVIIFGTKQKNSLTNNDNSNIENILIEMNDGKNGHNGLNGKPGRGGIGGCDLITTKTLKYILFIPVRSHVDVSQGHCYGRNRNGVVIPRPNSLGLTKQNFILLHSLEKCQLIKDYKSIYESKYIFSQFNDLTVDFINSVAC